MWWEVIVGALTICVMQWHFIRLGKCYEIRKIIIVEEGINPPLFCFVGTIMQRAIINIDVKIEKL